MIIFCEYAKADPMRVGLLLNSPSPHQVDLFNSLSQRHDVEPFIGYIAGQNMSRTWGAPKPNLPWQMLPARLQDIITGRTATWLRQNPADIWVISAVYTSFATQYLAYYMKRNCVPYVFLGEPPRPRSGLMANLRNRLLMLVAGSASGIIATGKESGCRYRKLMMTSIPVISIPYYVDLNTFLETPLVPIPSPGDCVKFVTSGQLVDRKGVDVLLDACKLLPKTGWSLDIFGSGPAERLLIRQAHDLGDSVQFRGPLPYDRRQEAFRGYHCFVFSTRNDGWGMVLPEALAHGLPVISTDAAMSAHDFIVNGENGYMGPAGDAEFIARSMLNLIESPSLIGPFSIAARQCLRDYNPVRGAQRLVAFLKEVLELRKTP
jgi:glycosyltransferase involved in cell wall biosynthesis